MVYDFIEFKNIEVRRKKMDGEEWKEIR